MPLNLNIEMLERSFRALAPRGETLAARDVYDLVIREVERPLLETVLGYTRGNQVQAAAILGINRHALRASNLWS